mgnify:CR=1 FL=1
MTRNGHAAGARVILVGRTGLDQSLRASPDVELLRVRSTIEAIGELSQPLDDESPTRAIVVVGDRAGDGGSDQGGDRAGESGANDARWRASTGAEFVEAARHVDPEVVVVGLGNAGSVPAYHGTVRGASDVLALIHAADTSARTPATFDPLNGHESVNGHEPINAHDRADACAPEATGVETLISSILRPGSPTRGTSGAAPPISPEPASEPAVPTANDAPVVQAALRGGEILDAAMTLIRSRMRCADASFVPHKEGVEPPKGPGVVAVAWGEATFGWLSAPGVDARALAEHAAWLAGWLRLRDQQAELRTAAFRDPLTGAWNRRYFDRFLASALEHCRQSRRTLTLMVFDIDDFKKYNDRYGHAAGDEILAETVRLMVSVVRPSDRVCRIGGDEFGVIFYEPDGPREQGSRHPDSVCKIAARFQQQIGRHRFPKLGSEAPGSLTISGGLATFPWDGATVEQLMCRADERSMESKKCGKNAVTLGPSAIRRGE